MTASPFSSCSTTKSTEQTEDNLNANANLAEDDTENNADNGTNASDTQEARQDEGTFPHPSKATAWHTRVLLYSTPQPTADELYRCIDKVKKIGGEAGNPQDMLTLPSQITSLAASQNKIYHFCFYQMMLRLDERLDKGGALMSELAPAFLDGMKTLWIFARGLDALDGRTRYYDYLYVRYVQLSKQYFGRDVERIGQPMGNYNGEAAASAPVMAKPAGPAPIP